ncbi:complement C1q-like protein 2 [Protopterus annectens]|uniref:complement C1q-like protein 2 n=1 Tax=Protopterus annectens TaxID=7888 RepID=UPI001CFA3136|nr:complement C1q-like protein 2 [Protopterus annectens]
MFTMKVVHILFGGTFCLAFHLDITMQNEINYGDLGEEVHHPDYVTKGEFNRLKQTVDMQALQIAIMKKGEELYKERLNTLREELKKLKDEPKIVFSASVLTALGPFDTARRIDYTDVTVNEGNAYNPTTGVFTAYIRGVYFFSYTAVSQKVKLVISLMKNDKRVVSLWNKGDSDSGDLFSNAVILSLEVGDWVYIKLQKDDPAHDNENQYITFIGFLMFPL